MLEYSVFVVLTLLSILSVSVQFANDETSANKTEEKEPLFRLPRALEPYRYEITLDIPYPEEKLTETYFNFTGNVTIYILGKEPTNEFIIHQNLEEVQLYGIYHLERETINRTIFNQQGFESWVLDTTSVQLDNMWQSESSLTFDNTTQTMKAVLEKGIEFKKDECYCVTLSFRGKIQIDPDHPRLGVMAFTYNDLHNETQYLIATLLEPDKARRLFPSFDEPDFKSSFEISVVHSKNVSVLSNEIAIESTKTDDYRLITRFQRTPKMSTYLVVIVMGALVKGPVVHYSSTGVQVVGWTIEEYVDQIEETGRQTKNALDQLSQYFDYHYPLPRLGYVVFPGLGLALETFGLIFYGHDEMPYGNRKDLVQKAHLDLVASHEVAHQWIGNIITVRDWGEAWLQEGLTSFMHSKIHSLMYAGWTFDTSGCAMFKMLERAVGEGVFKRVMQKYVRMYQYDELVAKTLWDMFTEEAASIGIADWSNEPLNVSKLMKPWITEPGFPLIGIERDYSNIHRNDDGKFNITFNITQSRFYPSGQNRTDKEQQWIIPLWFRTQSHDVLKHDVDQLIWITEKSQTFTIPMSSPNEYILANTEMTVFCRINYDSLNWRWLGEDITGGNVINTNKQAPRERAQLLDDAFTFAENGMLEFKHAFQLADHLGNDWEHILWLVLLDHYEILQDKLGLSEEALLLQKYVLFLDIDRWSSISFDAPTSDEIDNSRLAFVRETNIKVACAIRSTECLQYGSKFLATLIADCEALNFTTCDKKFSTPLVDLYICAGMQSATQDTWDLINAHADNQEDLKKSLICTEKEWAVAKLIEERYTPKHYKWLVKQMNKTSEMSKLLWNYLTVNLTVIERKLDVNNFNESKKEAVEGIIGAATFWMTNTSSSDILNDWKKQLEGSLNISLNVESIQKKIEDKENWYNKHKDSIANAIGRMSLITYS